MKILDRYTLKHYLAPLIWCFAIFLGLYLIFDLLGHLDEILRNRVRFSILFTYYGTMVPLIFVQMAPFSSLMATLYAVGNLNRHQEIMAMRASGVGPFQIVRSILVTAVLVSAMVLLVNELFVPSAALLTQSIKTNYLENQAPRQKVPLLFKTIEHLAAYGSKHTLVYAQKFDPIEKKMEGVVILQHDPNLALRRKITAQYALWTGSEWRFINGAILQFNNKEEPIGRLVPFESKLIDVGDRPEMLMKSENIAAFMNAQDLLHHIRQMKGSGGATIRRLQVDFYAKFAAAIGCFVLTLVGIPFAIQPVRGGGTIIGLSVGLGVGLAFYAMNAVMLALGKGGWLPPWSAAFGTHILFSLFALRTIWDRLA